MNMNPFAAARIHTHAHHHLPIAATYCRKMNLMGCRAAHAGAGIGTVLCGSLEIPKMIVSISLFWS